jgi:pimeloyl-ACP methyl ester carboxylesterase
MPLYRADDLEIYYELVGQGEPMLLVHGFGGTGSSDWRNQIPEFSQKYQLIVPDLRGHGRTDHPEAITGPEFFELATSEMVDLVSDLDLGPVHVCGFSMGAAIASGLYYLNPSLVRSLVLVSGAARVNRSIAPKMFDLWESMSEPDSVDAGWAKVLARLHGEDKWRLLLRNYAPAVEARVENVEDVVSSRLGNITCPALVIQGSKDLLNPVLLSQELSARIPDSELVLLESDHWVPGLRPTEFNTTVLDFLVRRFPSLGAQ